MASAKTWSLLEEMSKQIAEVCGMLLEMGSIIPQQYSFLKGE